MMHEPNVRRTWWIAAGSVVVGIALLILYFAASGALLPPRIGLIDVASGEVTYLKSPSRDENIVLGADDKNRQFYSSSPLPGGFQLEKISYDGKILSSVPVHNPEIWPEISESFALCPHGDKIVHVSLSKGCLEILDVASGQESCVIPDLQHLFVVVRWAADDKVLMAICRQNESDGTPSKWIAFVDPVAKTSERIYTCKGSGPFAENEIGFSRDLRYFAFSDDTEKGEVEVKILDVQTKAVTVAESADAKLNFFNDLCWSPDGTRIACANTVRVEKYANPMGGPQYRCETSLVLLSTSEKKPIVVQKVPGEVHVRILGFLDNDRIIYQAWPMKDYKNKTVFVLNLNTRAIENSFAHRYGQGIFPVEGGKKILCSLK